MEILKNKHYMDFRGETDFDEFVWPTMNVKTDEETRIRVYCTSLMSKVLENINSKNDVLYHASLYYKIGDMLAVRFPHRSEDLVNASIIFWQRVQSRIKEMK